MGVAGITTYSSGVSTITSANPNLVGLSTIGNLVSYTGDVADPIFGRITAIDSANNNVTVTTVNAVSGINADIANDAAGISALKTVSDLKVLQTSLQSSSDNTLFTKFPKDNISNVDLTDAVITIRKTFDVEILNNQITASTVPTAGTNETFLPFDEERYSLVRKFDGVTEVLTSDKFTFTNGNGSLQIKNVGSDLSADQGATLVATLAKTNPKAKVKRKQRVNSIIVTKSKIEGSASGGKTLNLSLIHI